MKKYKLLKEYKHPDLSMVFQKEHIADASFWYDIFMRLAVPYILPQNQAEQIEKAEKYCGKYPDWFAEIKSHPSKEEIIEGNAHCIEVESGKLYTKLQIKSCMEKWESSLKEQLIEKIEQVEPGITYSLPDFKPSINKSPLQLKSEIISLIRNFKSE